RGLGEELHRESVGEESVRRGLRKHEVEVGADVAPGRLADGLAPLQATVSVQVREVRLQHLPTGGRIVVGPGDGGVLQVWLAEGLRQIAQRGFAVLAPASEGVSSF